MYCSCGNCCAYYAYKGIIKYQQGNRMRTSEGKTSFQIAREALDKAGLNDVQVKKTGYFFKAVFLLI